MSDPTPESFYDDLAEGTSLADIENVLRNPPQHTRRDSQIGSSYGFLEDEPASGAIFDGPSSFSFPSSVSNMYHERSKSVKSGRMGNSDRRMSRESVHSRENLVSGLQRRHSVESQAVSVDLEDPPDEETSLNDQGGSQTSASPPPISASVFGNIASFFGRPTQDDAHSHRPGLSRRSSRYSSRSSLFSRRSLDRPSSRHSEHYASSEERWGYASEEEGSTTSEVSAMDRDDASYSSSRPPSRTDDLPLLSRDTVFGDTYDEDADYAEARLPPPPPGQPSRQVIFLPDEEMTVRFVGYEVIYWRKLFWRLLCVVSAGALALVGHWFPGIWLKWTTAEKSFDSIKEGFIVVVTAAGEITMFPIEKRNYPYTYETVFPAIPRAQPSTATANGKSGAERLGILRYVDYRHSRFVLDPRTGLFVMLRDWRDMKWSTIAGVLQGLHTLTRQQRLSLFGFNEIDIKGKSIPALLIDEVIHPFYVFQIASIILWSIDDYYYYAFCIAVISAFSICTTLFETRKTIAKMREMSKFSCPVGVLIDGHWQTQASTSLAMGDIINLATPALAIIPADVMLLSGDAIVNESMLTGESVPVGKVPATDADLARWRDGIDAGSQTAKSLLYFGTKLVRVRKGNDGEPLGLVIRVGFDTTKGSLIRSMLFPKPMGFKFYRDSMRFISVLAGIAGLGFMASAVQFIRLGVAVETMVLRALDLITVVVPPALPATLSIGTSFAIGRLRKAGIFCISPNRVNVAGKVNVVCFDKTGTLTEEGLDILGVRIPERTGDRFGELVEDARDLPLSSGKTGFLYGLATCHSLKLVDGETVGDPLDVKMFDFTDWTLEEGESTKKVGDPMSRQTAERAAQLVQSIVRPPGTAKFRVEDALKSGRRAHFLELGVIRTFEFISALRRMSVIVKRLKSSSMEIYVKGAPEVMTNICKPESFPQDYDDLLSYYTKRGYRVIGIAGKSIDGLTWLKAQRMKREQAETELSFLGLIVFENKIKPGTPPAIQKLRNAHMGCRMVTGDNPRTAVSVARECGIIDQEAHVFYPSIVGGGEVSQHVVWASVDDETFTLDEHSLRPLSIPHPYATEGEELSGHDYTLAVTGDAFRWMINNATLETLERMLVKAHVYARMSPDEKHEVVERLQDLGYTVAFCGDGANDCGALKAADVGISLSEAEASIAAPFTSQTPDIGCVLEVIKEGRAALVTSFSCFKYMALYSLIQFTTITLLYSFASSLGDFQFLYIDLFIIIPIAVTMGRTLPFDTLHSKRPTASLVSKRVLSSIIGQIVINSGVQTWAFFWIRSQQWYEPPVLDTNRDKLETFNYENTALFLTSCFQYILVAAVFSIGPPYRKPMRTNALLVLSITILSLFSTVILLSPPRLFAVLLDVMYIPMLGRLVLLGGVLVNVTMALAFERYLESMMVQFLGLLGKVLSRRHTRLKEGNAYKAIETGMMRPTAV